MRPLILVCFVVLALPLSTKAMEPPDWKITLSESHALVGKIWRPDGAGYIAPGTLIKHLSAAEFVFLGEKHDNSDHHRLQAWILDGLVAAGQRPAVVWEMITEDKQDAIDTFHARRLANAEAFGAAVDWDRSGWPSWQEYKPIADIALKHGLPMIAGSLSRSAIQAIGRGSLKALPKMRTARLGLNEPLPTVIETAMLDVVTKAHCDLMPRSALGPMVSVQRARDAVLADNMVNAQKLHNTAVMIAGGGHARRDLGAPKTVDILAPGKRLVTMAFLEVEDGETEPGRYAARFNAATLPFDFVWFTPRANDRDYCAELRKQFKGHKN